MSRVARFIKINYNLYINMDNVIAIHHCSDTRVFELTTTGHKSNGFFLMGSGANDIESLTYKFSYNDNPISYELFKEYLSNE